MWGIIGLMALVAFCSLMGLVAMLTTKKQKGSPVLGVILWFLGIIFMYFLVMGPAKSFYAGLPRTSLRETTLAAVVAETEKHYYFIVVEEGKPVYYRLKKTYFKEELEVPSRVTIKVGNWEKHLAEVRKSYSPYSVEK